MSIATTTRSATTSPSHAVLKLHVPILTYHRIRPYKASDTVHSKAFITTPTQFEDEMRFLRENNYTAITLTDLIKGFNGAALPDKPVIITFDDGYNSQYVYAVPILTRYHFVATFFIYTNATSNYPDFMTWDQLADLHAQGMIIGAHTKSHPKLTKIKNKHTLTSEIVDSKKILEEKLGIRVDYFAYPYGLYNNTVIDIVKNAGFLAGVGLNRGSLQSKNDSYTLERDNLGGSFESFVDAVKIIPEKR